MKIKNDRYFNWYLDFLLDVYKDELRKNDLAAIVNDNNYSTFYYNKVKEYAGKNYDLCDFLTRSSTSFLWKYLFFKQALSIDIIKDSKIMRDDCAINEAILETYDFDDNTIVIDVSSLNRSDSYEVSNYRKLPLKVIFNLTENITKIPTQAFRLNNAVKGIILPNSLKRVDPLAITVDRSLDDNFYIAFTPVNDETPFDVSDDMVDFFKKYLVVKE